MPRSRPGLTNDHRAPGDREPSGLRRYHRRSRDKDRNPQAHHEVRRSRSASGRIGPAPPASGWSRNRPSGSRPRPHRRRMRRPAAARTWRCAATAAARRPGRRRSTAARMRRFSMWQLIAVISRNVRKPPPTASSTGVREMLSSPARPIALSICPSGTKAPIWSATSPGSNLKNCRYQQLRQRQRQGGRRTGGQLRHPASSVPSRRCRDSPASGVRSPDVAKASARAGPAIRASSRARSAISFNCSTTPTMCEPMKVRVSTRIRTTCSGRDVASPDGFERPLEVSPPGAGRAARHACAEAAQAQPDQLEDGCDEHQHQEGELPAHQFSEQDRIAPRAEHRHVLRLVERAQVRRQQRVHCHASRGRRCAVHRGTLAEVERAAIPPQGRRTRFGCAAQNLMQQRRLSTCHHPSIKASR